ncbi:PGAP1-like alpha/beta domain-containing protein [Leifsonia sp. Leaf264]|uniref:PGAP1-like alpha/beta domain-containing protein n=1 Tax=Leifsonia sp. Leaf264 TaxID=1736314 RepID=UPI000700D66E|nr:alpha/beta hydrolase [Leifsonia sp. Leaf264]KQO97457.1 alpha/beta hydrolase [Leifsonia sp. Leaf264]
MSRAVVLVSGGAAVTPFTTPDAAAGAGLPAGNTMTALRSHLLQRNFAAYTAPARIGRGTVTEDLGWQGFSSVPEVLPADMTINAVGHIEDAGAALNGFLDHLADTYGVDEVDLVGHSMGGLFSRAAIPHTLDAASAVTVRSLVTLGTPWTGAILGDYWSGDITVTDAHGDAVAVRILEDSEEFARENNQGAADDAGRRFLASAGGWNDRQAGALTGTPVTVIAGDYFDAYSSPDILWPHDGLVTATSALAQRVPGTVLPHRTEHRFRDVHSIFVADSVQLPWERAITWDPEVLAIVGDALEDADRGSDHHEAP